MIARVLDTTRNTMNYNFILTVMGVASLCHGYKELSMMERQDMNRCVWREEKSAGKLNMMVFRVRMQRTRKITDL